MIQHERASTLPLRAGDGIGLLGSAAVILVILFAMIVGSSATARADEVTTSTKGDHLRIASPTDSAVPDATDDPATFDGVKHSIEKGKTCFGSPLECMKGSIDTLTSPVSESAIRAQNSAPHTLHGRSTP